MMKLLNTHTRYGMLSMALHWLTLLLLIAVYASVELHDVFAKGSAMRDGLTTWHGMLGLLLPPLLVLRLAFNSLGPAPQITPLPPRWQMRASRLVHVSLYALLAVMPLLGWLVLSARGKPVPFFGLELPALIGPDRSLGRTLKEIHEWIGNLGYMLIGAHSLAALFHHYVMRDNTLLRMLPERR